ncbi:hypothetical protein [Sphingobium indicum]|nr:hypothetical protein [Sphingobium indicum]EPR17720.1 hypothetical protein M527_15410 [Sphingobium indicum IP26]
MPEIDRVGKEGIKLTSFYTQPSRIIIASIWFAKRQSTSPRAHVIRPIG